MKNKKAFVLLAVMATMLALIFSGCGAGNAGEPADQAGASFKVTGLPDGDITATMSDIQALKVYEGKAEGADSEGNPVVYNIKGGYFSDLLQKNGYSQADLAGIRIIATDGYSIEVPPDILKARDVIIAYEMDGKPLDKDNAPFRVFIPGERAMYWVRMVSEINVLAAQQSGAVTGVYIADSLYGSGDWKDYEYIGENYKVLDTKKIISDYPGAKGDVVLMTGADGLNKNETLENFCKGVISMTGENAPEFFSSTLPSGMFVKNLAMFKYGGNAFYFAATNQSATLEELKEYCGLDQADEYALSFADGTEQTFPAAELASWTLGAQDNRVFIQKQGSDKVWDLELINVK